MEFKVGSLMNFISGKSDSKELQPAEQKIVYLKKPKVPTAKQLAAKKGNKASHDKKSSKQPSNLKSPQSQNSKAAKSKSTSDFKGTFKRGVLTKSFKNLRIMQGSKPEVPENSSETVMGKSFKYIDSDNTSNIGDITDGCTSDKKQERTVFVGNLPLTQISEKAITKLFAPYGEIESFRLRSIPVKDLKVSRKVAAIKGAFHPGRTNTNAYVVMKSKEAAEAALALNGTVLEKHHLRVDKASASEEHDPRKAIFLGNVSFKAEEEDLWGLFQQCGEIDHVRIVRDKTTSVSKGAAYVNFKNVDSVELALTMEGAAEIHGRPLKIRRCLPGRKKSLHKVTSRNPGPRNTDETNDGKARSKEEQRFQKKMKRRERREALNSKNEALGLRSRASRNPASGDSTAKSFVGLKAEDQQQKRKKKRLNKEEVRRKKVAKILANAKSAVGKTEEPPKVVDIDAQPNQSSKESVTPVAQNLTKKSKKKLSKAMKKAAPKTILLERKGEIKKKKLKKMKN